MMVSKSTKSVFWTVICEFYKEFLTRKESKSEYNGIEFGEVNLMVFED